MKTSTPQNSTTVYAIENMITKVKIIALLECSIRASESTQFYIYIYSIDNVSHNFVDTYEHFN